MTQVIRGVLLGNSYVCTGLQRACSWHWFRFRRNTLLQVDICLWTFHLSALCTGRFSSRCQIISAFSWTAHFFRAIAIHFLWVLETFKLEGRATLICKKHALKQLTEGLFWWHLSFEYYFKIWNTLQRINSYWKLVMIPVYQILPV